METFSDGSGVRDNRKAHGASELLVDLVETKNEGLVVVKQWNGRPVEHVLSQHHWAPTSAHVGAGTATI